MCWHLSHLDLGLNMGLGLYLRLRLGLGLGLLYSLDSLSTLSPTFRTHYSMGWG